MRMAVWPSGPAPELATGCVGSVTSPCPPARPATAPRQCASVTTAVGDTLFPVKCALVARWPGTAQVGAGGRCGRACARPRRTAVRSAGGSRPGGAACASRRSHLRCPRAEPRPLFKRRFRRLPNTEAREPLRRRPYRWRVTPPCGLAMSSTLLSNGGCSPTSKPPRSPSHAPMGVRRVCSSSGRN